MFKVGQDVFWSKYGKGIVKSITHSSKFPIEVEFDDKHETVTFTMDGCKYLYDEPVLYPYTNTFKKCTRKVKQYQVGKSISFIQAVKLVFLSLFWKSRG